MPTNSLQRGLKHLLRFLSNDRAVTVWNLRLEALLAPSKCQFEHSEELAPRSFAAPMPPEPAGRPHPLLR